MTTKYDLINGWLEWASQHTSRQDIFLAGVGLLHEQSGQDYYAAEGFRTLFRDAENECDGIPTYRQETYKQKF